MKKKKKKICALIDKLYQPISVTPLHSRYAFHTRRKYRPGLRYSARHKRYGGMTEAADILEVELCADAYCSCAFQNGVRVAANFG